MNPFIFIDSINYTKKNLMDNDPLAVKTYNPFIVNRGLSYFEDTIFFSNEINKNNDIPKEWQYLFYLNSITKKKRYSKWFKKIPLSKECKLIMEYYGYSVEKAKLVEGLHTADQLKIIETKLNKGGANG